MPIAGSKSPSTKDFELIPATICSNLSSVVRVTAVSDIAFSLHKKEPPPQRGPTVLVDDFVALQANWELLQVGIGLAAIKYLAIDKLGLGRTKP